MAPIRKGGELARGLSGQDLLEIAPLDSVYGPMARDLFHELSPSKLRREIQQLVVLDQRSLPENAKIFAALVKLQGFDAWPDLVSPETLNSHIDAGETELNRGICGTRGVPAILYARELVQGIMYPGTQVAFGHGIYFSTVSALQNGQIGIPAFPRMSHTAAKYCNQGENGVILRCSLNSSAKILRSWDLVDFRKESKSRAREAQIKDLGTLAASLGYDALECDKLDANQTETWYVVVNRKILTFQTTVLQHGHETKGQA